MSCDARQPAADEPSRPKHVILIGLDTVRADHLGAYGSEVQTPHLDSFAKDSVLFENHSSTAPWTLPSFASLFTGLLPSEHGCISADRRLPSDYLTIAEVMRDLDYRTRAFVGVDWLTEKFGLDQGFDEVDAHYEGPVSGRLHRYHQDVKKFIDDNRQEDFFLFVHYYDVHAPYRPPQPFDRLYYEGDPYHTDHDSLDVIYSEKNRVIPELRTIYRWLEGVKDLEYPIQQYAAGVTFLDHYLGDLFAHLKKTQLYEDALILLVADHGEDLGEHQFYFAHRRPYQEVLGVPFIVHFPGGEYAGTRVRAQTSSQDILPTLVQWFGYEFECEATGIDLLPLIRDPDAESDRFVLAEWGGRHFSRAIWNQEYRAVITNTLYERRLELFDRENDRAESRDLSESRPWVAQEFIDQLKERLANVEPKTVEGVILDDDMEKRLEDLGYLKGKDGKEEGH